MLGPMMQAALEDRFKLKVHHESRETAVYELVVAKNGPRLSPFKEGACVPEDWTSVPPRPLEPGQRRCNASWKMESGKVIWDVEGMSLDQFAAMFNGFLDRPLVNATGVAGLVRFHLEYDAPDSSSGDPSTAFAAFKQQLGLELHPAKRSLDFLVIDHVERPTPNSGPEGLREQKAGKTERSR